MTTVKKKITTNTRVIKDILTRYKDTFSALCELINNSLQASSTEINIIIDYNDGISKSPLNSIILKDNGYGVPYSDFERKILEIGTTVKEGGQGIGRFGALQIGESMKINTVSYDEKEKAFSKVEFLLQAEEIQDSQFNEIEFKIDYDYFREKNLNTYYQISITNLYHGSQIKISRKNKIVESFLYKNIKQALFEKYPLEIFHKGIKFRVNDELLQKENFVIGKPGIKKEIYTDKKGVSKEMSFYFYNVKANLNKIKVFFQIDNAGLKTVAHEYTYSSDWYTPDLGTWFIYVDSPLFNSDLFRNIDIESLGFDEIKNIREFIKNKINDFFKGKNKKFENFLKRLETDKAYPYRDNKPASDAQEILFKKVAYFIEESHQLLKNNDKIREFLYPLLDRAICNGNIEEIFKRILKLSDENAEKFHSLLQKTDLEDVVYFASQVADKMEFLEFLQELIYGDISKVLKERCQLHKIIEKELWLFGESYNGTPALWSDKKIGNILTELRNKYFNYLPTVNDENLVKIDIEGVDNITDLFFLNEKIKDNEEKEIMLVELKSPSCAISRKEIQQIDDYAFTLEKYPGLPKNKVHYKLILISSHLSGYAKSKLNSAREKYNVPFLYDKKTEKNIEIYILEWSEIIELNKRRLGYLSNSLKVKDKSVREKFETEYAKIIDEKLSSRLYKVV